AAGAARARQRPDRRLPPAQRSTRAVDPVGHAALGGERITMTNQICHFEIGCRDREKTADFYAKMFAWTIKPDPAGTAIRTGGDAGATRGAGRGIARALGEAGALVYCTGRSVRGAPSPYGRPETIDETAEMIAAVGGKAVAVRVDHASEGEVQALVARIDRDHGRLDVLVNSIAGEEPMMRMYGSFWQTDLANADAILRQSLVSHIITSKHAAPLMI